MLRWRLLVVTLTVVFAGAWFSGRLTEVGIGLGLIVVIVLAWRVRRALRTPVIRDWREAEEAAARWLQKAGCRHVMLTGGSADGGIDVITDDWAIQVKHTERRVGRPAVQQMVGAALSQGRYPALFSTSGFTSHAYEYADEHEVALFELTLDGSAHAANRFAKRLGRRAFR